MVGLQPVDSLPVLDISRLAAGPSHRSRRSQRSRLPGPRGGRARRSHAGMAVGRAAAVIPNYQKVIFSILLVASLAMGGVLWRLRERAHERLVAGQDSAPPAPRK